MTGRVSPGTQRRYPLTMICAVYRVPRSSVYAAGGPPGSPTRGNKPGPKTAHDDADVVEAIRAVLAACPFHGDGTIITDRPDVMWGTDATRFYTERDGWCWLFGAIDHHLDEVVGWHTAKLGDRWAALEPIRQGVRHAFGRFGKDAARGVAIRCDWGPQYTADAWINEVKWLGITISPSYVGEPACNGVAERFMRTLKEQCIYLHQFASLAEAQRIIGEFEHAGNRLISGAGRRHLSLGHRRSGAHSHGQRKDNSPTRNSA
jgi:putative transposase